MELGGKTAFVTGAGTGIGRACAIAIAQAGGNVALVDINEVEAHKTADLVEQTGRRSIVINADVTDEQAMALAVEKCVENFGSLDCAVNNAGILGQPAPFENQSLAIFQRVLEVNVMGVVNCAKAQINQMLKQENGGAIVNMASGGGLAGLAYASDYVASKHAVVGLTKTWALEFSARGIQINALCPGFVKTTLSKTLTDTPENMAAAVAKHPIGRLGEPEEIAEAVVFLLSSRASFMAGSAMVVDGGYTAQ